MAWAIALLLFGNWVVGLASGAKLGWWLHTLFVLALVSAAMGLAERMATMRSKRRRPVETKPREG